ncbi:unnamed protein product, partial [Symbiodinium sp. CCMP2456]
MSAEVGEEDGVAGAARDDRSTLLGDQRLKALVFGHEGEVDVTCTISDGGSGYVPHAVALIRNLGSKAGTVSRHLGFIYAGPYCGACGKGKSGVSDGAVAVSDPPSCFSLCPLLAAMAQRPYGDLCFTSGRVLSSYRHCMIAVQRIVLGSKAYRNLAWEMVSRWEALQPPVHRCPLPAPMLKAMRWRHLLAFLCVADRRDPSLPKVSDAGAVGFIPWRLLWHSSPAAYRNRFELNARGCAAALLFTC